MALKFPVIFLLPTNLEADELHELEDQIPTLTFDINEAEIVLGKIGRKQRALFELRKYKLATEEVTSSKDDDNSPRRKRARTVAPSDAVSDTASDDTGSDGETTSNPAMVKVAKLTWFTDSLKADKVLPLDDYIVYEGRKAPVTPMKPPPTPSQRGEDILKRALADPGSSPSSQRSSYGPGRRGGEPSYRPAKPPLLRQSTTEHDVDIHLPPIPEYLRTTYSCQRPTPIHPPNELFIEQLIKIRTARTLIGDKIGVRAYSSAIATLSAYPYTLSSAQGMFHSTITPEPQLRPSRSRKTSRLRCQNRPALPRVQGNRLAQRSPGG
jgi:DNA polymerase IV